MIDQNTYIHLNVERAARTDLGAELSFNRIIDSIKSLKEGFGNFTGDVNSQMSNYEKQLVSSLFNKFKDCVELMLNFRQNQNEDVTAAKTRQDTVIVQKLNEIERDYISYVVPIICKIKLHSDEGELNRIKQEIVNNKINLDHNIDEFEKKKAKLTEAFNQEIANAQKIVEDAKDFSINSTSKKYGIIFKNQAVEHKNFAMISLLIFVLSLPIAWLAINYLFLQYIEELFVLKEKINIAFIVTGIVYRLTLISLILLFIKELLKNYNVNMNLYNLNKHKQNSLESFDVFMNVQKDPTAKGYIAKKIVDTVYSSTRTGYLSEDKKSLDINQLTELIKALK